MKANVIMPFTDRETKKTYNTGAEIECTEKRFAEIRKSGNYVVEVKEEKAVKADKQ